MHVDNKRKCGWVMERENASNQELEMPISGSRSGKNCTIWPKKEIWRWKWTRQTARRKEKKELSRLEKFVTVGNEKADEPAKAGATLDEGFMAEMRAKTVRQE